MSRTLFVTGQYKIEILLLAENVENF